MGNTTFMRTLPDNASTVSIYNTAHSAVAGGEVGTQSNRPATDTDLTTTSYRAALIQFRKWRTDRNMRIPGTSKPKRLVISEDLRYTADEILNNPTRVDSGNEVKNVTKGATSTHVTPYMDDPDMWIIDGEKHHKNFKWRWRPRMDAFDDRRKRVAIFLASRAGAYLRGSIIGHGEVAVVQCLRLLKRAGYDGVLSIEFEGMEDPILGISTGLRNLKRYLHAAGA